MNQLSTRTRYLKVILKMVLYNQHPIQDAD